MGSLLAIDWAGMFVPSVSPLEIVVRGSLVYLALFALIRGVLRREGGAMGLADLLLIVLIADAAQNAMSANYQSVTDGILLVATLIFWNFALDWLAYRSPVLRRILHPPPLLLIKDGKMLRRNMRQESVTEEELMGELRKHGVGAVAQVREARIEGDGQISVLQFEPAAAAEGGATNERRGI